MTLGDLINARATAGARLVDAEDVLRQTSKKDAWRLQSAERLRDAARMNYEAALALELGEHERLHG